MFMIAIIWLTWSYVVFAFQDKQEVIIEKVVRNKRKSITTVKGLELFGELYFSCS
jgi:translation initiation factor 1 (eIF-1/SUI1)